jgi:hypothetical protein
MGDVGCEIAPLLLSTLQLAYHFIETPDEIAEHIRSHFRDADGEIAGFYSIDGVEKIL